MASWRKPSPGLACVRCGWNSQFWINEKTSSITKNYLSTHFFVRIVKLSLAHYHNKMKPLTRNTIPVSQVIIILRFMIFDVSSFKPSGDLTKKLKILIYLGRKNVYSKRILWRI